MAAGPGQGAPTRVAKALRSATEQRSAAKIRVTYPRRLKMTIKVGDKLPDGQLQEFIEVETAGCSLGPNTFQVADLVKGKKIVIFGLPGAYTPTCSAKHVPGYVRHYDALKATGIDEIWCMAVNDAFVMGAWGREQQATGKVRMMADGSADYTKKLGLELDLPARGMGVRCQRFSMLVDNGVVKKLNIEAPGKFEVSDAETMLKQHS
jgi:peroxiredoxin